MESLRAEIEQYKGEAKENRSRSEKKEEEMAKLKSEVSFLQTQVKDLKTSLMKSQKRCDFYLGKLLNCDLPPDLNSDDFSSPSKPKDQT